LDFNASTGAISGKPSAKSPTGVYTVTASNGTCSTTAWLWITVD
jgi:hypothetical protein